jgi:hypothetical protein
MAKGKKLPAPISENFLRAYLETALWSSTDESDDSGGEPLDKNYSIEDFSDKALAEATKDCNSFEKLAKKLLDETDADDEQHGHDFWLTRNGHGAGFWDRGYGKVGDELSKIAKTFGEAHIYVGDDGKLHFG